jgi:hypothetical protein
MIGVPKKEEEVKYLNHMSSSVEDQKHEALIDRAGLAGYGAYWIIAEKIAGQIRPEQVTTFLSLKWRNWARHLHVSTKSAQFLLRCMADARLILLRQDGDLVTIGMPNILKYADEYSRRLGINSRQTPDKLPSDSGFPALPALPEVQDLRAREAGGSLWAPPANAPEELEPNPKNYTLPKCSTVGCQGPATIGKKCRKCVSEENSSGTQKEACLHKWLPSGTCRLCCAVREVEVEI